MANVKWARVVWGIYKVKISYWRGRIRRDKERIWLKSKQWAPRRMRAGQLTHLNLRVNEYEALRTDKVGLKIALQAWVICAWQAS